MSLDAGFATPIQISTTLWSYIRPGKGGTRPPRSLLTVVGLCHKKIVCKVDDPAVQHIHNENADGMLLASFVVGLAGKQVEKLDFRTRSLWIKLWKLLLPSMKRKSRKRLAKVFMPVSQTRWNCMLPAGRAVIVTSPTAELRRGERATARKRSAIWRHAPLTCQRPQQTGMNKRKLRLDVMNARDSDTSQRSVQHD